MLKGDLVELKTNLYGALDFIKLRLEIAGEIEKPTLEYLLPMVKKAYEIAKLIEEIR